MKFSINNIMAANKLPLIIAIIVPIIIIAMNIYFNDISISLYILILFFVFTGLSIYIILNPFWGMVLLIIYMPYSGLITIPIIESVQRVLFILITIGWFLKYFQRKKSVIFEFIKSNKIIMLFILSMVLSSTMAVNPLPSFKMSFQLTSYIFMAFIMQDLITDKIKLRILVTVIAINIGIISLFTINNYLITGVTNEHGGFVRFGSFYGHANQFGKVLVFGIPFLAFLVFNVRSLLFKSLCLLMLLSSIFSLGLTLSRAFMLAFLVFTVAYVGISLKNKTLTIKQIIIILLIIVVISSLIFNILLENIIARASKDVTEEIRYDILLKGVTLLMENPVFGIGWQNFQRIDTSDKKYNLKIGGRGGHEIISSVFVSIGMFGSLTLIILFYIILKWLNEAAKCLSLNNDNYMLNLSVSLQAGYIAFLSAAVGTGLIFGIEFWLYYALSGVIYRLNLRDTSYAIY